MIPKMLIDVEHSAADNRYPHAYPHLFCSWPLHSLPAGGAADSGSEGFVYIAQQTDEHAYIDGHCH
jgi:hypothetical protein